PLCFSTTPPPPRSTLFPYTTLFRSRRAGGAYDPHLAALATDHFAELLDGLDDALIWSQAMAAEPPPQRWMTGAEIDAAFHVVGTDRKSTRLNSSHDQISYAVFCLKK